MNYKDSLVKELKEYTYWLGQNGPESHDVHPKICDKAASYIEDLYEDYDYFATQTVRLNVEINDMIKDIYKVRPCSLCKNYCGKWNELCTTCDKCTAQYHPSFEYKGEDKL